MSVIVDNIIVRSIDTIKNSFETDQNYAGPDKVQVQPVFELSVEQNVENKNQYRLTMKTGIGTEEGMTFPYRVETMIQGVFELKDIPAEKHQDVLRTNCAAVMFPYARANVSTIMACSGVAPYVLPVMNMEKLFKKQD